MALKGYSTPRSPEGRSSLVPAAPVALRRRHAGDRVLGRRPRRPRRCSRPRWNRTRTPGRAAALFVDWQSCSDGGEELLDPARSQYREFFITVNALYEGEEVAFCPYIWVDRDFALARGWIQGFPKKLGSVWITRTFGLDTLADPGLRPGSRFAGTCAANDRRLAEATVTLREPSAAGPTHNDPPIVNVRHLPRLAKGSHEQPAVHELVRSLGYDRTRSEVWEGDATLELFEAPNEEHTALAPVRVGKGFRFTLGYSVDDLETLTEL